MPALDDWTAMVGDELGLGELSTEERDRVLEVARDVAHGVLRPAAPLSTFLLGVAVGRGADMAEVAARISALAGRWPAQDSTG